jgi:hypothetical protein
MMRARVRDAVTVQHPLLYWPSPPTPRKNPFSTDVYNLSSDPETTFLWIPPEDATRIINTALKRDDAPPQASALLATLDISELTRNSDTGIWGWFWKGAKVALDAKAVNYPPH